MPIDYKRIIKSPAMRGKILDMLRFVPDKQMLELQYRIKTGRKLDLKNPQRYTEKLQWYKLYYRNPIMRQCVDKYAAREYVTEKGLGDTLVPLIGVFDSVAEINWDELPESFIMKSTNGGGGLNVFVCPSKEPSSVSAMKDLFAELHAVKPHSGGREWAYCGIQPKLIVEELLVNEDDPKAGINDYKIFCYAGEPKYIIVDVDRYIGHKRNFYDIDWNNMHITSDCPAADREIPKPQNLDEMLRAAETLSAGFPYVRVDLYSVREKVYFGELTFYPWSGYVQYQPDRADFLFGNDFELAGFEE